MTASLGFVATHFFEQAVLTDLLASVSSGDFAGALVGLKVALVKADFTPGADLLWTDLTEADFSGYAESASLTWGTIVLEPDGSYTTTAAEVRFTASGSTVTNTIYGIAVFQTVSAVKTLAWTEKFDAPVQITLSGNAVIVVARFGPDAQSTVNAEIVG